LANLACGLVIWWAMPSNQDTTFRGLTFPTQPNLIEIEGPAGRIRLERVNAGWSVTQPYTWPANPWEVQRLLGELALVREANARFVDGSLPAASADKWKIQVGADNGQSVVANVTLHGSNIGTRTLRLDGGERGIGTAGEPLLKALSSTPEAYRMDAVFDIPAFEVRAVGIRQTDASGKEQRWGLILESREKVERAESPAAWHFEAPLDFAADVELTPRAVASLSDLHVARFLPRRTNAVAEKPAMRISVEGVNRRQVLMIWPAKDGFCEACLEDNPSQPFLLEQKVLATWENPVGQLRSRQPCDFDPAGVKGITLTNKRDGRSLTLHRIDAAGATGRWEMPVLAGSTATRRLEVSVGRAQQFLRLLTALRVSDNKPAVIAPNAEWSKIELDFATGKLTYEISPDPAGGRIFIRPLNGEPQICAIEQSVDRWISVSAQDWRTETLARLQAGTQVARMTLINTAGKTIAEARLGTDTRWVTEGEISSAQASQLAASLSLVQAHSFSSSSLPFSKEKPVWSFSIRVTDRSAAGAAVASETTRNYRVSRAQGPNTIILLDESDGTEFVPEPALIEALTPWSSL
jgi:hypothetical protein